MKLLKSSNILLITPKKKYLDDFYDICSDPLVTQDSGWINPFNREQTFQTYLEMKKGKNTYWLKHIKSNKVIGSISFTLKKDTNVYELGFFIHRLYQNQGYMSECIKVLLHYLFIVRLSSTITISCYANNTRCQRIAVKKHFIKDEISNTLDSKTIVNYYLDYTSYLLIHK